MTKWTQALTIVVGALAVQALLVAWYASAGVCSASGVLPFFWSWILALAPTILLAGIGLVLSLAVVLRFSWKGCNPDKDMAVARRELRIQFLPMLFGVVESLLLLFAAIMLAKSIADSCAPATLALGWPIWLAFAFLVLGTLAFAATACAGVSFASLFACCSYTPDMFEREQAAAPACFGKPPDERSLVATLHTAAIVLLGALGAIALALMYVYANGGAVWLRTAAAWIGIIGFGLYSLATLALLIVGARDFYDANEDEGSGSDMIALFASLLVAFGAIVSIAIALVGSTPTVVGVVAWLVVTLALASCCFCCLCWGDAERFEVAAADEKAAAAAAQTAI